MAMADEDYMKGWGSRPARAWLELFPLHPGPMGQLLRILLRYGLSAQDMGWEGADLALWSSCHWRFGCQPEKPIR